MHNNSPNLMYFSIIVPVYNEEEVFLQLLQRIQKAFSEYPNLFEVIFVNDGSTDHTRELIEDACSRYGSISGIHFSRNFGHQQAVSAGMRFSRGKFVAVIDGDLQDPPEAILEMLARAEAGHDVVYGVRQNRKEGLIKRALYRFFYRILENISSIGIPLDSGDFSVVSRRVVNEINAMGEYHRFVRGLRSYVGFSQTAYEYEREARAAGKPKYTLAKLLRLASDGIVGFSDYPLRLASMLGGLIAAVSLFYALVIFLWRLFSDHELEGFATLGVGLFFLGGVQLIFLGILGEYLGRVYNEVKKRPSYIISDIDGKSLEEIANHVSGMDIQSGESEVAAPPNHDVTKF